MDRLDESPRDRLALLLTAAAGLLYTWINLKRLDYFHFLEWDLSIYAQGAWKLSRFESPYVSIRELHLFGDHASFSHVLLAPLFWLWSDARVLVLVESAALSALGLLIFREARERLERGPALLVLLVFLAHPATQFSWFEYYTPDVVALPFLLAAYRAVVRGKTRAAAVCSALALLTKENVALTVFALGLYGLISGRRRVGAMLCVLSALYLAFLMKVAFPFFNPGGYIYSNRLYGAFAPDLPSAIRWLAHPAHLWQRISMPESARYLSDLFAPLAFLPALAPLQLAIGVQLPLNLISSWGYARSIHYHYSLMVLPFLFAALAHGLARFRRGSFVQGVATGALLACAVTALLRDAPIWTALRVGSRGHPFEQEPDRTGTRSLIDLIPKTASVAAHYRFLPALCLRDQIYLLPRMGPPGSWPEYVLFDIDRARESERDSVALQAVLDGDRYERIGLVMGRTALYRRRGPAR